MKEKILFCWSGGKDSALALYQMQKSGSYDIFSILTTITKGYDRISMHGVRKELLQQQADSMGIDLIKVFISKKSSNQEYESKMRETLEECKKKNNFRVAFGDILLEDLKKYREERLAEVGLEAIFPLWKRDTKELAHSFIDLGFKAVISCVNSKVLGKEFVGKDFDKEVLSKLPSNVDPCGENGEFHSFVYDGSIFKERIPYKLGEIVLRNEHFYYCDLIPLDSVNYYSQIE